MTAQEREHTKASFFAMIRADPTNNDNRLIFADWCEENGEAELAGMLRGGSEKWLRDCAEQCDISYRRLMDGAESYVSSQGDRWPEYLHMGYNESYKDVDFGTDSEFWKHYEVMTGINVDKEHRGSFFSCAC